MCKDKSKPCNTQHHILTSKNSIIFISFLAAFTFLCISPGFADYTCYTDADNDGHISEECGGDDCDDGNIVMYTGNTEVCGDTHDNDCDGLIDCKDPDCCGVVVENSDQLYCDMKINYDKDNDGYYLCECQPKDYFLDQTTGDNLTFCESYTPSDCDDGVGVAYPGNTEICGDTHDNDCDGIIDCNDPDCCGVVVENSDQLYCDMAINYDKDSDGYYSCECQPKDYFLDQTTGDNLTFCESYTPPDCNDEYLAGIFINPDAQEDCADNIDNDCDRQIDCDDSDCYGKSGCQTQTPIPEFTTMIIPIFIATIAIARYNPNRT